MSFPTKTCPWYAVTRLSYPDHGEVVTEYWSITPSDAISLTWTPHKKQAQLFMSVQSASRIAEAEGADILVVWDKNKYKEFRDDD